jgi:hypothetical protein
MDPFPMTLEWRAPKGGITEFGHYYKGGEFLPFYVPRTAMPQIDEKDLPELVRFALDHDVKPTFEAVDPRNLRAHQKVERRYLFMPPFVMFKPLLTSQEAYVLDGNHRWHAHVQKGSPAVPIIRLSLPFEQAVKFLFEFPATYAYGDGEHPIAN